MTLVAEPPRRETVAQRLVGRSASLLGRRTSRRGFLVRSAVVGSALLVEPAAFVLRPGTAYAAVCGPDASCSDGYTVFCCTVNGGQNSCPPGNVVGGWWKAAGAGFCGGGARYYIDCHPACTGGCDGDAFCGSASHGCSCRCQGGATCDQRRVCCNYFRYGQCHPEVGCTGPVGCRVVTCVPPWQLDPSCSTASFTDDATAAHSADCLPSWSAIQAHYWAIGGPRSPVGDTVGPERPTPDGGSYQIGSTGHLLWSPGTGAHEVHGQIRERYAALGWEAGPLGYPISDELTTPGGAGRYNHFSKGASIYWTPATGAHAVYGGIRVKWAALGWEAGTLGFPITDELGTPDGVGRYNHFTGGSIYWTLATDAHEVHGAIRSEWARLRWEAGPLGYPTTDELGTPDGRGRYNHFSKGGSIYSSPSTGTRALWGLIRAEWARLGWEAGRLGYPTQSQRVVDGRPRVDFQHGYAVLDPASGRVTVTYR